MKTLKDIADAIRGLPLEAFKAVGNKDVVTHALNQRFEEYYWSEERLTAEIRDLNRLQQRRDRDAQRAKRNHMWALIHVKPGMFIKVGGARDGFGLRKVIEVKTDTIVCQQWKKTHRLAAKESLRFDDVFAVPANQMTEHNADKVQGYFAWSGQRYEYTRL